MSLLFDALKAKYEAEIIAARAMLEVYFKNPAGVGEHPQILEELDTLVEKLAKASVKLGTLCDSVSTEKGEEV